MEHPSLSLPYDCVSSPDLALTVFRVEERARHLSAARERTARAARPPQSRGGRRVLWALRMAVRAWRTNAHRPQAASPKTAQI
jgi:hypothetical protein